MVHLPVYRTYADAHGRDVQDTAILQRAIHDAAPHLRRIDRPVLTQLDACGSAVSRPGMTGRANWHCGGASN